MTSEASISMTSHRVPTPPPVRVPSPPPLKEMDSSYNIEIKAAVHDRESGHFFALKLQNLFADWVKTHKEVPPDRQYEMFQSNNIEIIRKYKADPEKSYELIDPAELPQYRAFIDSDAILPFENPGRGPIRLMDEKKPLLFVIRYNPDSRELELFVSPNPRHTHASFLLGKPVAAAGEFYTREGRIVKVNNQSGHYRPEDPQTVTIIEFMKQFHLTTPVMLEKIERGAFCKGKVVYSCLSLSPEMILKSTIEVRVGKIPEILLKNSDFQKYYSRERHKMPEAELQQFRKNFLASDEWEKVQTSLSITPEEYMKRRFALISFASLCWNANVRLF